MTVAKKHNEDQYPYEFERNSVGALQRYMQVVSGWSCLDYNKSTWLSLGACSLVGNLTIKKGLTNHAQIGLELELLFRWAHDSTKPVSIVTKLWYGRLDIVKEFKWDYCMGHTITWTSRPVTNGIKVRQKLWTWVFYQSWWLKVLSLLNMHGNWWSLWWLIEVAMIRTYMCIGVSVWCKVLLAVYESTRVVTYNCFCSGTEHMIFVFLYTRTS